MTIPWPPHHRGALFARCWPRRPLSRLLPALAAVPGLFGPLATRLAGGPTPAAPPPGSTGVTARPGSGTLPTAVTLPGAALFTSNAVARIDLELSKDSMNRLRRAPREDVPATVEFEGQHLSKVSVHLKGRVGSFRALDDKPAFTLRFDKLSAGQTLDRLTKIHLNNSVEDPGYLNEALGTELFQAAGIPAVRVGHAWVQLWRV